MRINWQEFKSYLNQSVRNERFDSDVLAHQKVYLVQKDNKLEFWTHCTEETCRKLFEATKTSSWLDTMKSLDRFEEKIKQYSNEVYRTARPYIYFKKT